MISLCMIVKNEEENIGPCIESVESLVDEIIVVDTGSDDKTLEILNGFSDCKVKVYQFQWTNDFSEARNFALSQATEEWILVLDADERLNVVKDELIKLLNTQDEPVIRIPIYNLVDHGTPIVSTEMQRLFKKENAVYRGAIHEQLTYNEKVEKGIELNPQIANIVHYGYLEKHITEKNKRKRNLEIITSELEKNPENAFYWYHLGIQYMSSKEYRKALEVFEKWGQLSLQKVPVYYTDVVLRASECLYELREYDKLAMYLDKFADDPLVTRNPLYYYQCGRLKKLLNEKDDAFLHFVDAMKLGDASAQMSKTGMRSFIPRFEISDILLSQKKIQQAIVMALDGLFCKENISLYGYEDALKVVKKTKDNQLIELLINEYNQLSQNKMNECHSVTIELQESLNRFYLEIESLINQGRLEEAKNHIVSLETDIGLYPECYAYKGIIYLMEKKYLMAYICFAINLRYKPKDSDLLYNMSYTAKLLECHIMEEYYQEQLTSAES